jgi:mannose-6-phosphate isomerase class I
LLKKKLVESGFNKFPSVTVVGGHEVIPGWHQIGDRILEEAARKGHSRIIIMVDYYPGVLEEEITRQLVRSLHPDQLIETRSLMKPEPEIRRMVDPDVTDDRLFGVMTRLEMEDFFDYGKIAQARHRIGGLRSGMVLITGTGAALVWDHPDLLVYADMARWEIQLRMRLHEVDNLGVRNRNNPDWMLLYKQGFFVDWRVADRWKKRIWNRWDHLLDTNDRQNPKMVRAESVFEGLRQALQRPFSVVPFFDPGPWGGQWMKEHCHLDPAEDNYAWCFNCVPEENSLLLDFGTTTVEIPSINLVFFDPEKLLGNDVYLRFGDEFPIRFDFLDTMGGGNLSLQVHPLEEYIRDQFGMTYTQDESYYLLDAAPDARVYLGLKEGVDPEAMTGALLRAQEGGKPFEAEKYVQTWPAGKHDHFLIPAGTVHCSGKGSMVLEISATPYIFTFKLWDWGRLGLDGKPRPINIGHGIRNIQWSRTASWTAVNLVNRIEKVAGGNGWTEERTGLHELEFIETRRHWFTDRVPHHTGGTVNVICLVEGKEAVVESPSGKFPPFHVHYAETFIVPAAVGEYTIRPAAACPDKPMATLKAWIRKTDPPAVISA